MKVLLIPRSDMEGIVSMREVIDAVEAAFKAKALGRVQMPSKTYVIFSEGDFRTMSCYIPELGVGCVKIVNSHPGNPERYGMPAVMATIVLIEPETGRPLTIMDGTWITSMRTGAAGGIAAKYLARRGSEVVGLVGAGMQARAQLMALSEVFRIEEVRVCAKTLEECRQFKDDMEYLIPKIYSKEHIEGVVKGCDILVTTTPVTKPIVKNEWVEEGTHINAIGADAPGKEELDPTILRRAKIVVDDYEQAMHSGEINVPISQGVLRAEQIYAELGEIIAGLKGGRANDEEITIFDSTGLAIQDLATAALIYRKISREGKGIEIDLL